MIPLLKFLHVAAMFLAVTVAYGFGTFPRLVARTGDVAAIRATFGLWGRVSRGAPVLFVIGGAVGLATAFAIGYDLAAPWLLIAYALFVLVALVGVFVEKPWHDRVRAAAAASPADAPSDELRAVLRDPVARAALWFDIAVVVAFVFDMIVKPFS